MQRNLQVVVNKLNVVVISVVVVLIVLFIVVSSVRVIVGIEGVPTGVATENVIVANSEASSASAIAGVVNPNGGGVPVGVVPPVGSKIGLGRIYGSRDLGELRIGNDISQRTELYDSIILAAIERSAIADIHASIFNSASFYAGLIANIDPAPISGDYIGGREAESIARIDIKGSLGIGDGNITEIAAARIIGRYGKIERIS